MILADEVIRAALLAVPRRWENVSEQRFAAVLAAIFHRDGADHLLFTERHADLPEHPGQIAFPGGARDGEEDPSSCALRESQEEVGLVPSTVTILGALPNRSSTSSFRVHALVARITSADDLTPDPTEVESIFSVPLAELFDEARWQDREAFEHAGHTIWGLTGRFTRDLIDAIRAADSSSS